MATVIHDVEIITSKEMAARVLADVEEQKLLKEIEESFCVAGYEIIGSTIFKETLKQQARHA